MMKPIVRENPFHSGTIYDTVGNQFSYDQLNLVLCLAKKLPLIQSCYEKIPVFEEAAKHYYSMEQINDFTKRLNPILTNVQNINKLYTLADNSELLMSKLGCFEYCINNVEKMEDSVQKIESLITSGEFANALNSIKIFPTKTKRDLEQSITETAKATILKELNPICDLINNFSCKVAHITAVTDVYLAKEYEVFDEKTFNIKKDLFNQALDSIKYSEMMSNNETVLREILSQSVEVDITMQKDS